jgi:DNA recombination protein RmuC
MEIAAFIFLGLLVGGVIGWLYASRESAGARQTVENLRLQLDEVVKERDVGRSAASELAALKAAQDERDRGFEARIKELIEAKETLVNQFREIGDKLLEKAQADFLAKADDRISKADKDQSTKLQALLQPVEATLKRYQEGLQRVEADRKDSYGELRGLLGELKKDQGQVRDETRNLVNTLRASPKARGKWGEQGLKNVLEQAGLSPYADFRSEVSVESDDGRLRPDVVVRLPGDKHVVIDAKCSLKDFMDASDEIDDEKRKKALKKHASSIRNHVQQLGSKSYWAQFESVDYVIMYIPGENFLTAALDEDDGLWNFAFDKRVLLATPTNLVAIARTISMVWRQEKLAKEAAQIADLGKELHSRVASMASHVVKLGRNLELSTRAYNQMVGSLETQVLTQAKRFETLGAGSAKIIEDLPIADTAVRDPQKLIVIAGTDTVREKEGGDKTGTAD